jgi:hypothetical protein
MLDVQSQRSGKQRLFRRVLAGIHQHAPERPLLSPESGLRLKRVESYTPDWLACILEKTGS